MSFHIYLFAILFHSGAPPKTLLTAGALTGPQLPATASNEWDFLTKIRCCKNIANNFCDIILSTIMLNMHLIFTNMLCVHMCTCVVTRAAWFDKHGLSELWYIRRHPLQWHSPTA